MASAFPWPCRISALHRNSPPSHISFLYGSPDDAGAVKGTQRNVLPAALKIPFCGKGTVSIELQAEAPSRAEFVLRKRGVAIRISHMLLSQAFFLLKGPGVRDVGSWVWRLSPATPREWPGPAPFEPAMLPQAGVKQNWELGPSFFWKGSLTGSRKQE